jgi:hypothetical protein
MSPKGWHILHRKDKWGVRREGTKRDSVQPDTKAEAENRAREIVENPDGGEVVSHDPDGEIQNPDAIDSHDTDSPEDTKAQGAIDSIRISQHPRVPVASFSWIASS